VQWRRTSPASTASGWWTRARSPPAPARVLAQVPAPGRDPALAPPPRRLVPPLVVLLVLLPVHRRRRRHDPRILAARSAPKRRRLRRRRWRTTSRRRATVSWPPTPPSRRRACGPDAVASVFRHAPGRGSGVMHHHPIRLKFGKCPSKPTSVPDRNLAPSHQRLRAEPCLPSLHHTCPVSAA